MMLLGLLDFFLAYVFVQCRMLSSFASLQCLQSTTVPAYIVPHSYLQTLLDFACKILPSSRSFVRKKS